MGFFRRAKRTSEQPMQPTPFVAEVLQRIGEQYGGFDSISPLPPERGGPAMEFAIHIDGEPDPGRPEFAHGTGILRFARVFTDRTEVYDENERLLARFDDLTKADAFGG